MNRLPFRDEVALDGSVRRLFGRYASIVIFDQEPPVGDGSGGIDVLDAERLSWLRRVSNYTDTASELVRERHCTCNLTGPDGSSVCGKCILACPSEALGNSSPLPDGAFRPEVAGQKHRFWEGTVDFDYGNCTRFRGQKGELYEDYVCARCEAICAARGVRKKASQTAAIA